MSPVATWSSEWHRPLAASLTWSSPVCGSSASSSVTSHLPGAERMIAPRVSTGTGNLLVALVEGLSQGMRVRAGSPRTLWPPSHRGKSDATFAATSAHTGRVPDVPVVVVGAGPVGLTAALLLARRGVPVLVLERYPEPYPLPRAVHLDDEVLRVL